MKTLTTISLFSLALACALPTQAQSQANDSTLNRTVVIENQYNPQIMDANKINVLPAIEEPQASKKQIEYATGARPFGAFRHNAMPVFGERPTQPDAPRSYIHLGYGNNGNVTAALNYLFNLSEADKLNVNASFDGKNFEPDTEGYEGWKSRFYQSNVQADYVHKFTTGELGAQARFGTQAFNYLPMMPEDGTALTDKQSNMLGGARLFFRSTNRNLTWQYHAEAGISHFGRSYLPLVEESNAETKFRFDGGLSYGWNDNTHRAGLDLRADHATFSLDDTESNGIIGLTPYYELRNDAILLRVGADIDLTTGIESGVNIAPDVTFEYTFNQRYKLYAQAGGGTLLNDYFRFNELTPYWLFYGPGMQFENTHVQLDASAGFKASPVDNLWLNFFAGYELRDKEMANTGYTDTGNGLIYGLMAQGKANNFKAGLAASYRYKDLIEVSLDGTYRSWSTDDATPYLLWDKPELDLRLDLGIHPVAPLTVNLGYRHCSYTDGVMETVGNLHAGVDYRFFDFLSVWAKATNLMNKDYSYYFAYPEEGINFTVGASFRF